MAGFADIIKDAQPSIYGLFEAEGTVGRTWEFAFEGLVDDDDAPIPLTVGYTVVAELTDRATGASILTFDTLLDWHGPGSFVITKPDDATAAVTPGVYGWRCHITDVASSTSIQIWGGPNAAFTVRPA